MSTLLDLYSDSILCIISISNKSVANSWSDFTREITLYNIMSEENVNEAAAEEVAEEVTEEAAEEVAEEVAEGGAEEEAAE